MPEAVLLPASPLTSDYLEALKFQGKKFTDVTYQDWEMNDCAISAFSPSAFCYYLPSIYCAGIIEERTDLLVIDSIIASLDRTADINLWDDFFYSRWGLLTVTELEATSIWLDYLLYKNYFTKDGLYFSENSYIEPTQKPSFSFIRKSTIYRACFPISDLKSAAV